MGKTMREVFGRTLQDMKEDPKLVVLDADLGSATKALLFKEVCPERYIGSWTFYLRNDSGGCDLLCVYGRPGIGSGA